MLVGFIEQVREAHPRVPLAVRWLQTKEPNLGMIDGLEVLGVHEDGLLADGLHPSAEGYRVMAQRIGPRAAQAFCGAMVTYGDPQGPEKASQIHS